MARNSRHGYNSNPDIAAAILCSAAKRARPAVSPWVASIALANPGHGCGRGQTALNYKRDVFRSDAERVSVDGKMHPADVTCLG